MGAHAYVTVNPEKRLGSSWISAGQLSLLAALLALLALLAATPLLYRSGKLNDERL